MNDAFKVAILPRFTVAGVTLNENVNPLVLGLTVNVVITVVGLPATSVPVIVMVCGPTPTNVPAAGLCCKVTALQLSDAKTCGSTFGIGA